MKWIDIEYVNYENALICKEVFLKKAIAKRSNKTVVFNLFNLWIDAMVYIQRAEVKIYLLSWCKIGQLSKLSFIKEQGTKAEAF